MSEIILYDHACRALANARNVDEVRDWHNKADAMRHYAHRAKNRELEISAAEIRMLAERRLGQMLAAQKEQYGLHRGGRPAEKTGAATEPVSTPSLQELGIDKKLSARAQKMAALPAPDFEARMASWRATIEADEARVTVDLLKHGEEERQRQARRDLAQTLSDTSAALTGQRKYPAIYADPAVKRKGGEGNRSYENHYRTMTWDEIIAMPVRDMLLPDAWGYIWLPRAHLLALHPVVHEVEIRGQIERVTIRTPLAWAIAQAWGFDEYSTCHVWSKTDAEHETEAGTGLVWRDQNEVLCLFKRGRGLPILPGSQRIGSEHRERSKPLGHSRKPQFYREMIATMVGDDRDGRPLPVLELFGRADDNYPLPPNWSMWGNEAGEIYEAAGKRPFPSMSPDSEGEQQCDTMGVTAGETASQSQAKPECETRPVAHEPKAASGVDTPGVGDLARTSTLSWPAQGRTSNVSDPGVTARRDEQPSSSDVLDIPAFLRRRADNSLPTINGGADAAA